MLVYFAVVKFECLSKIMSCQDLCILWKIRILSGSAEDFMDLDFFLEPLNLLFRDSCILATFAILAIQLNRFHVLYVLLSIILHKYSQSIRYKNFDTLSNVLSIYLYIKISYWIHESTSIRIVSQNEWPNTKQLLWNWIKL